MMMKRLVMMMRVMMRMVGRRNLCLENSEIDGSDSQTIISKRMHSPEMTLNSFVKSHMIAHKTLAAEATAQVAANEAAAVDAAV